MAATPIDTKPLSQNIRIRFTRLGLHFVFVAVFAMAGGAVRGFNLLLVLAGCLIAVLLLQWRCSRRMMEILSVKRALPRTVFAGQMFEVDYTIRNHYRWTPAWMIRVDDSIRREGLQRKHLLGLTSETDTSAATLSCGVGHVAGNAIEKTLARCVINRRGRYVLAGTKLSSSFPFALLCGTRTQDNPTYLDAFPQLLTVHRQWQQYLSPRAAGGAATARRSGANDGEFYGLRPWQRGDSPRQIHWRTTARIGDLAVRQTEESKHLHACFLIDGYLASSKRNHQETLETTISLAATLAVELSSNVDDHVCMVVAGQQLTSTDSSLPQPTGNQALHLLSAMNGDDQVDLDGAVQMSQKISGYQRSLVVLSTRSLSDALASVASVGVPVRQSLESQLAALQRQSHLKWIDVSDPNSATWYAKLGSAGQSAPGNVLATGLLAAKTTASTVSPNRETEVVL